MDIEDKSEVKKDKMMKHGADESSLKKRVHDTDYHTSIVRKIQPVQLGLTLLVNPYY